MPRSLPITSTPQTRVHSTGSTTPVPSDHSTVTETNSTIDSIKEDVHHHAPKDAVTATVGHPAQATPLLKANPEVEAIQAVLEELQLIDEQIGRLDQEMATLLSQNQDAVRRLAEVPGLGVDSAQQIIAEVDARAATFPSAKQLSSWVGACPGDEESAGVSHDHRSPKGNRNMRRILNQSANAAVKVKGSIFEIVYRRTVPRLGHQQTIGVVAHRQCRLVWKILHEGVRYEERGLTVSTESKQRRTARMIRALRNLGYRVEPPSPQPRETE